MIKIIGCLLLLVSMGVWAEGMVYEGGTKTVHCTDATERTDGTPLLPEEIERVEIYVRTEDGAGTVEATILMPGGCRPMSLDLSNLTEGQKYQDGVTYDTAGRVSAHSVSLPFEYLKAPPGPPVMTE